MASGTPGGFESPLGKGENGEYKHVRMQSNTFIASNDNSLICSKVGRTGIEFEEEN
jgi:hypothetical protein